VSGFARHGRERRARLEDRIVNARVLVCGGRDFTDADFLFRTLDDLRLKFGFTHVIHGQGQGADQLAYMWAASRLGEAAVTGFPADWIRFGKSAGPKRNAQMLNEGKPDFVIAFPGGKGTADMVRRARRANVPVVEVTR
jgi:hypothetical protein